jgi:hypothetical protein
VIAQWTSRFWNWPYYFFFLCGHSFPGAGCYYSFGLHPAKAHSSPGRPQGKSAAATFAPPAWQGKGSECAPVEKELSLWARTRVLG